MKCRKCGYDNSNDSIFCANCGERITVSSTAEIPSTHTNEAPKKPNKVVNTIIFIAIIIFICFITISESVALTLFTLSLLAFPIILIVFLVKKIKKKPAPKCSYTLKLLIAALIISLVNYIVHYQPDTIVAENKVSSVENTERSSSDISETGSSSETQPHHTETDAEEVITTTDRQIPETAYVTETTTTQTEAEPEPAMQETNDSEYFDFDCTILGCTPFSEGKAWIQFNDKMRRMGREKYYDEAFDSLSGDEEDKLKYALSNYSENGVLKAAVIDTEGKIIWESELTRNEKVLKEQSEFKDGLAYCIFSGNDGDMYYIVDAEGNTTYKTAATENYKILFHAEGKFFVIQHISNFDVDEWQLGVIDKYGSIISPFTKYSRVYGVSAYGDEYISAENSSYIGDDIIELYYHSPSNIGYCCINTKTQNVIFDSDIRNIDRLSDFKNGKAYFIYRQDNESFHSNNVLGEMDTDGNITEVLNNTWTSEVLSVLLKFNEGLTFIPLNYMNEEYTDYQYKNGAYYDIKGNLAIDFEQYRDKHYYECGPFNNGYAVMSIEGADEKIYYTVINKNGDSMFDPKSGYTDFDLSNDGRYIYAERDKCIEVFDITGKLLMTAEARNINDAKCTVNDGMMNIYEIYINIHTGQIIGCPGFMLGDLKVTIY